MSKQAAIKVSNLCKKYLIYNKPIDRLTQMLFRGRRNYFREFNALNDVSFEVHRGEVLGIIGRNGSGKSTLLQLICGTLSQTSGEVVVDGRISALLELGSGFNSEFSGRENIYLNASILGLSKAEIDEKYESIVEFSGIAEHIEQPVKTYSSGMYVRLAFAVAIATDPDILIVDEALAVGDEIFQRKCFAHFEKLIAKGSTILFVSHSANMITKICNRVLLIDRGELLMIGGAKQSLNYYHKLIYAPQDKAEDVRNEILSLGKGDKAKKSGKKAAKEEPEAGYLPDMTPESTIRNENKGVKIGNVNLYDLSEQKVNNIKRGDNYSLRFEVSFTEAADNVRFNMRIRNKEGQSIAGANTTILDVDLENVLAGEGYDVAFDFECLILPNTYFIEVGCSSENSGKREPLARVTDAMMFKVIAEFDTGIGGLVDIGLTPKIERL